MDQPADIATISWLRFLIAATTVLGLMGLLAWSLKLIAQRGWIAPVAGGAKRLRLIESLTLDARRRIVIVRCDDAEHLILLGAAQDAVVKTDISRPITPASQDTLPSAP